MVEKSGETQAKEELGAEAWTCPFGSQHAIHCFLQAQSRALVQRPALHRRLKLDSELLVHQAGHDHWAASGRTTSS